MESLYLLIPFALLLVLFVVAVLFWAIRHGQFDDMEGPAHSILLDDDKGVKAMPDPESEKLDPDQNA